MLINAPRVVSAIPRLVVIPLVLFTCGFFFLPQRFDATPILDTSQLQGTNITEASSTFNASVHDFWQQLAVALVNSEPQCEPLKYDEEFIGPAAVWKPLEPMMGHAQRLIDFTDKDETALFRAHYTMRTAAQHLARKLPFAGGTTGIVTTANANYMPILLVSLRLLRRTGCEMPVEVFIDDWSKYEPTICETVLPSLNAHCVVLSNIYDTAKSVKQPDHFQYKIFAILFSSFQHVLFLDSDTFPVYDPSTLFDAAPYTSHGLVTWPDYWALTISSHFYHIAAIPEVPPQSRRSTESGQLLLNKDVHRESLLMMVYYNYYGPDYYYPLLSQGSHGAGDKETFVQAALAVGLPYHQVKTSPTGLGWWANDKFRGTGIAQADPKQDYEYLGPSINHIHRQETWQNIDLLHDDNNSLLPKQKAPRKPRPIFFHQNELKLDPAKVLENKKRPTYDLDETTPHRVWGPKKDMVDMAGYDIEKRVWEVIVEEGCRENQGSQTCADVKEHLKKVF